MDYNEPEKELAVSCSTATLLEVFFCCFWLLMSDNHYQVQGKSNSTTEIQPRETKLEARVAKFISLICNVSMMKQQMMEIGSFFILLLADMVICVQVHEWTNQKP